jgi:hypothetical protein
VEHYDETPCNVSAGRLDDLRLNPVLAQEPLVASCCLAAMDCILSAPTIPPPSSHPTCLAVARNIVVGRVASRWNDEHIGLVRRSEAHPPAGHAAVLAPHGRRPALTVDTLWSTAGESLSECPGGGSPGTPSESSVQPVDTGFLRG